MARKPRQSPPRTPTRRPRPVREHQPAYPSVLEPSDETDAPMDPDRRGFLGQVALGAAGLAGGLITAGLSSPAARARGRGRRPPRPRPRPLRVSLPYGGTYTFRYGNYALQRALVETHDPKLVAFIGDAKERAALTKVVRRVLDAHTCADLLDTKRLARLRGAVAKAVRAHYRARTRRRPPQPVVILAVGIRYSGCKGRCPAPTPICRPPRPSRP